MTTAIINFGKMNGVSLASIDSTPDRNGGKLNSTRGEAFQKFLL